MSQNRFRQIARLELAARPYIGMRNRIEHRWQVTCYGAAGHAAILAFLIRYGDPKIEEPLSCAWQRFQHMDVWKQYLDKWEELERGRLGESPPKGNTFISRIHRNSSPFDRDGVSLISPYLRHELLKRFSGSNEKEKLAKVFASAPPWLVWFAFGDYTAKLLGLPTPDLATVMHFARSKEDFANWCGQRKGAAQIWLGGGVAIGARSGMSAVFL